MAIGPAILGPTVLMLKLLCSNFGTWFTGAYVVRITRLGRTVLYCPAACIRFIKWEKMMVEGS